MMNSNSRTLKSLNRSQSQGLSAGAVFSLALAVFVFGAIAFFVIKNKPQEPQPTQHAPKSSIRRAYRLQRALALAKSPSQVLSRLS